MKLQEYQARKLLEIYQVPVSRGTVIFKAEDSESAFKEVANPIAVAKVQVLMGGRGKAGGVVKVKTPQEAHAFSEKFLGKPFSTYQSNGESKVVRAIFFSADTPIQLEYYLGIVMDRNKNCPVILVCKEGGVEIEEVARKNPESIHKFHFSPDHLPSNELLFSWIKPVFANDNISRQVAQVAANLAKLFSEKDAAICEINPLALTPDQKIIALDAKIVIDDNALFRHEDLNLMKDPDEYDEREQKAKAFNLSYVSMTGNVGCLVNGAGLAMATMDMIKLAGGEPANFLDVGGGANTDQVREAFKIILQDERVEAILVNIFGGIMKCDVIADGIVQASKEVKLHVPLIVRLEGTSVEEGRALLQNSGIAIHSCTTIKQAAETAVQKAAEHRKNYVHTR